MNCGATAWLCMGVERLGRAAMETKVKILRFIDDGGSIFQVHFGKIKMEEWMGRKRKEISGKFNVGRVGEEKENKKKIPQYWNLKLT